MKKITVPMGNRNSEISCVWCVEGISGCQKCHSGNDIIPNIFLNFLSPVCGKKDVRCTAAISEQS